MFEIRGAGQCGTTLMFCSNGEGLFTWFVVEKGTGSLGITRKLRAFHFPSCHLSPTPLTLPTPLSFFVLLSILKSEIQLWLSTLTVLHVTWFAASCLSVVTSPLSLLTLDFLDACSLPFHSLFCLPVRPSALLVFPLAHLLSSHLCLFFSTRNADCSYWELPVFILVYIRAASCIVSAQQVSSSQCSSSEPCAILCLMQSALQLIFAQNFLYSIL